MMPSWYESLLRRKRQPGEPVPPEFLSGVTPPFNPEEPMPIGPLRQGPMGRPNVPLPPQPPEVEMEEPPLPTRSDAQGKLTARMAELTAAEERQRQMPGWRKALGGVLEGIGSRGRGGLGGIARVGGEALSGRGAVRDIATTLPAYERAADDERQLNQQVINEDIRRKNNQERVRAHKANEEGKRQQQLQTYSQFAQNPDRFMQLDSPEEYDPAIHSGKPFSADVNGEPRWFAAIKPEEQARRRKAGAVAAEQEGWQAVPEHLRTKYKLPEKASDATINNALRLYEMEQRDKERNQDRADAATAAHERKLEIVAMHESLARSLQASSAGNKRYEDDVKVWSAASRLMREAGSAEAALAAIGQSDDPDVQEHRAQIEAKLRGMLPKGKSSARRTNPWEETGTTAAKPVTAAPKSAPAKRIRVRLKQSGQTGTIDESDFDPGSMIRL